MSSPNRSLGAGGRLTSIVASLLLVACAGASPPSPKAPGPDPAHAELSALAAEIVGDETDPRQQAIRVFDYVRDEIRFGFTGRFDMADPSFTVDKGRGHCNPQTELFVTLLRSLGIEARQSFVTIGPEILDGLMPGPAPALEEINHSFAEVRLDDRWIRVDGYIVDPPLARAAKSRLRAEGAEIGYGAHVDSCSEWNGIDDCMSQFVSSDMAREGGAHGAFEPDEFYASDAYTQEMTGFTRLMYRWFGKRMMNRKIDKVRRSAPAPEAADAERAIPAGGAF